MTVTNNRENNNVWFVDMDGTIAEWRYGADDMLRSPGYFRSLAPTAFLAPFKEYIAAGGEVYILSTYLDGCPALADKNGWLDEFLPEVPQSHRLFVPTGVSKSDFVKARLGLKGLDARMVLFDDHSPNLHGWKAAGGRGVKCYNGINGNHGTWTGEGVMWSKDLADVLDVAGSGKKSQKKAIRRKPHFAAITAIPA